MRARNLKPGHFKNPALGDVSAEARWVWLGLACCADKKGRCPDNPRWLQAEICPYDSDWNVDELLGELASMQDENGAAGGIVRYVVDGRRYIQIVGFEDDHRPHHNEKKSVIPGSPANLVTLAESTCNQSANDGASREKALRSDPRPLTPDPRPLMTDPGSLTPAYTPPSGDACGLFSALYEVSKREPYLPGTTQVSPGLRKEIGKVVAELRSYGVGLNDGHELQHRWERLKQKHPKSTIHALPSHWDSLRDDAWEEYLDHEHQRPYQLGRQPSRAEQEVLSHMTPIGSKAKAAS